MSNEFLETVTEWFIGIAAVCLLLVEFLRGALWVCRRYFC